MNKHCNGWYHFLGRILFTFLLLYNAFHIASILRNSILSVLQLQIDCLFASNPCLLSQFVVNIMLHFSFRAVCCWHACCYRCCCCCWFIIAGIARANTFASPHIPIPHIPSESLELHSRVYLFVGFWLHLPALLPCSCPRSSLSALCPGLGLVLVVIAMFLTNSQGNAHGCLFIVPCMRFTFIFNLCRQFPSVLPGCWYTEIKCSRNWSSKVRKLSRRTYQN